MSFSTAHRAYNLVTPLGDDALLVHTVEGEEGLSRLFAFDFSLMSLDDDIKPADIIGKRVRLELETLHDVRHWSGIFVSFGRVGTRQLGGEQETEVTVYQAQLVPWAWQLQLVEDSRIFQGKNVQEIIELLLGEAGLSDFEFHLNETYPPLEYCVQYRESTFAFISRLLERAGIHYFFRHDAQAEVWVFTDNRDNNPVLDPRELRFALAAQEIEQDADDLVLTLSRRESLRSGRITLRDYDFTRPGDLLESSVPSVLQIGDNQSLERYLHPPAHFTEHDAGDRLARLLIEVEEADHDTLQGTGNARLMTPGYAFELVDHPDEALNQEYLVVGIHHAGTNNLFGEDTQYRNRFSVIPHQATWRAPLRTRKPHMHGPQTAMVVGPAGEEIHCDAHGRVKVQFHWDRRGKRDENSSCWLRVAQMWAGRGWGTMFIPRIGMEVVVDFLEGDPDAPLITGSVYNGVNTVPYALPRHSDISTLKSNSTKGGKGHNELRFVDRKGQEQLMLHAQNRMDICVGGNFCETNGGQRDLRVGKDFNLLNKGDLNWTAQSGWYQLVAKDLDLTVQANVHHDFQADLIEKVTGLAEMNPDTLSLVAANLINFKGKEMRAEYAADATLRGGTIVLEGSDGGLTFKCGGSFITIDQSGICISAPVVQINSGGAPKESTPANPAGPLVMEEPLEPTDCQCSTPGENLGGGGGGGGGSRQRRKKSLPGNNPPDWVPPKPPKPPVVPPPPAPAKPCSIQTLDIACAHNARKPDPGTRILQVVPDQGASSSGVSYGIESIKLKFSGNKSSGGTDTIKISGVAVDGGTAPIKTAVSRTPSPPAAGDFSGGASQDLKIVSPACDAWWPYPFKPEVYCIYGKGCDDAQLAWTVEAYPSLNYAGGLELSKFEELFKKLFGKDELSTQQKYGVTAGIKFAGPSGSMEAAWGWTENEDWRACFKVGLKAAVTFASVDGTARANLRDLLTAGALTFAGVPFNSSIKVFDALSEVKIGETAILDILSCMTLQLGLKLSIGLECAIAKKFFPDGTQEGDRGATLSGVGTIHADLLWRTGPPEVINASVKGTGEGPFEASGALSIESDGLHMKPKIAFKGLTIKIELEFNFFRVNAKQQLLNWTVLEARDLWPDPSDPAPPDWRLLPP